MEQKTEGTGLVAVEASAAIETVPVAEEGEAVAVNEILFNDPLARAMGIETAAMVVVKEKWHADTPEKATFIVGKVNNIRQLAADIKANAAAMVSALELDADRLESYFENDLRSTGISILSESGYNADGTLKKKTWKTLVGNLAFRTNGTDGERIEIPNSRNADRETLVRFCEENLLEVYAAAVEELYPGIEPDEIPPLVRETTTKDVLLTAVKPLLKLDVKTVVNEDDGEVIIIEKVVVKETGELVPFALVKPKETMKINQSTAAKTARNTAALGTTD